MGTTLELLVIGPPVLPRLGAQPAPEAAHPIPHPPVDRVEEWANSMTHGFGLLLSIAGLRALLQIAGASGSPRHVFGCAIYGVSLVLLYGASTLYHGCTHDGWKRVLLLLDHLGIYLLIAGTYTPLGLIVLDGQLGRVLLVLVWALAVLGSATKISRFDRISEDSPWSYLALSWMVLLVSGRIALHVPPDVFEWLVAGGLFYTLGVVFFVRRDRRFNHANWHLFVLVGSICHYRAVIGFVQPLS